MVHVWLPTSTQLLALLSGNTPPTPPHNEGNLQSINNGVEEHTHTHTTKCKYAEYCLYNMLTLAGQRHICTHTVYTHTHTVNTNGGRTFFGPLFCALTIRTITFWWILMFLFISPDLISFSQFLRCVIYQFILSIGESRVGGTCNSNSHSLGYGFINFKPEKCFL